ncbi:Uncharacterised protein [Mycobacteroides abscessus subsp. abscessus]|nr:Uncharacterised protein [Mycobacteroides abscessus subsp. abscessus]
MVSARNGELVTSKGVRRPSSSTMPMACSHCSNSGAGRRPSVRRACSTS